MEACGQEFGCIPNPPLNPPSTCRSSNVPFGHIPVTLSGRVNDPYLTGLAGACVYWAHGGATTAADGTFTLEIWGDAPATIFATKQNYTWNSIVLQAGEAISGPKTLQLSFLHRTSATPGASQGVITEELTFEVLTSAPAQESRVLVHAPDNSVHALVRDSNYSSYPGWARWTSSYSLVSGSPEGKYIFRSCVLDISSTGDCDAASGIVLSNVESADRRPFFFVDRTSPFVSSVQPGDKQDVTSTRPTFVVEGTDGLSGIDSNKATLTVDGLPVPRYGSYFWSDGELSLGKHAASVTIWDKAGNTAVKSWMFNVNKVSGTSPEITLALPLPEKEIPLGANSVEFPAVKLAIPTISYEISSIFSPGKGTWTRDIYLNGMYVEFKSAGVVVGRRYIAYEWPNPYNTQMQVPVLAVASTDNPVIVSTPPFQLDVGTIRSSVPPGCAACTAVLRLDHTLPGVPVLPLDPFPDEISTEDPILLSATIQSGVRVEPLDSTVSISGNEGGLSVYAKDVSNGQPYHVPTRSLRPEGDDPFDNIPVVTCSDNSRNCIATGQPLTQSSSWLTLGGSSGIRLYANHWLYRGVSADGADNLYFDWHQISSVVEATPCQGGYVTSPRLLSFSSRSSQLLLDSQGRSAWTVRLDDNGQWNSYTRGGGDSPPVTWAQSAHSIGPGKVPMVHINASLTPTQPANQGTGPVFVQDEWAFPGGLRDSTEQMALGVPYQPRASGTALEILRSVTWNVEVDFLRCQT